MERQGREATRRTSLGPDSTLPIRGQQSRNRQQCEARGAPIVGMISWSVELEFSCYFEDMAPADCSVDPPLDFCRRPSGQIDDWFEAIPSCLLEHHASDLFPMKLGTLRIEPPQCPGIEFAACTERFRLRSCRVCHDRSRNIFPYRGYQEARGSPMEVSLTSNRSSARSRPWRPRWGLRSSGTTTSGPKGTSRS